MHDLLISLSTKMMRRSFEKTRYRFAEIPAPVLDRDFGIYIHVPFCLAKCSFCPFYKELFTEERKAAYLDAILDEIARTKMRGMAKWLYFGGGTPNLLRSEELEAIVRQIKSKVQVKSIGIELLPAILTQEFLTDIREIGFTKISIGVESFSDQVMQKTGRRLGKHEQLARLISFARSLGLWVNLDLMVGLPKQSPNSFREDIRKVIQVQPSQVTIYPFMVIRGLQAQPGFSSEAQFALIEEAAVILKSHGYDRAGVWTFAQGDDIYDSSRDELIQDYIGFGPAAFSTYSQWKVVNPELNVYLENRAKEKRLGFVARKDETSNAWRRFACRVYDLNGKLDDGLPLPIRLFALLLRLAGYVRNGVFAEKGITFAHSITKTVVESLPFPVQNPSCVENYDEYLAFRA